jgi:hypothetical protein
MEDFLLNLLIDIPVYAIQIIVKRIIQTVRIGFLLNNLFLRRFIHIILLAALELRMLFLTNSLKLAFLYLPQLALLALLTVKDIQFLLEFRHILAKLAHFPLDLRELVLGFFEALAAAADTRADLLIDRFAR